MCKGDGYRADAREGCGYFYLMVCYLACLISEAQPAGSLTVTALLARMNSDVDGSARVGLFQRLFRSQSV